MIYIYIYIYSVGSWAGYPVFMCLSMFCCFSRSFSVVFLLCYIVVFCFRLVYLSFCICNRKNTCNNITKKNTRRQKKHKYIISQPEPEKYLFAVGSWAGYPVFLFVLCFSRSFSGLSMFLYVFVFIFA